MTFEGPEKKLELMTAPSAPSLRSLGRDFWHRAVTRAQAEILSTISNRTCDAYLLSESSLFVTNDRMALITCGRTTLVDAALEVVSRITPGGVRGLSFARRSEFFPDDQPTTFEEDASRLDGVIPGNTARLGDPSGDHLDLFLGGEGAGHLIDGRGFELQMRGLSEEARSVFTDPDPDVREIRGHLGLEDAIPGLRIDEHLFDPVGYSLNGLTEEHWCTLHVTPEEQASYASFECDLPAENDLLHRMAGALLGFFRPRRAALVRPALPSSTGPNSAEGEGLEIPGYRSRRTDLAHASEEAGILYQDLVLESLETGLSHQERKAGPKRPDRPAQWTAEQAAAEPVP